MLAISMAMRGGGDGVADKKEAPRCVCELVSFLVLFIASLAWRDEFICSLLTNERVKNVSSIRTHAYIKAHNAYAIVCPPQFYSAASRLADKADKYEGNIWHDTLLIYENASKHHKSTYLENIYHTFSFWRLNRCKLYNRNSHLR